MKAFIVASALLLFVARGQAQAPLFNSYPSATAVLFLDFDGDVVSGTNWNVNGPIYCGPSNLNAAQITEIFNRVSEDYRPFNLNVTTDSSVYEAAPLDKRMRVVFTITSDWYGVAGGVAYTNSFMWGNNTPCFVFTALHKYNVKNIAEAASHEAGHTFGLRHQAQYDSTCRKTSDYNSGTGSGITGWAPIMGVGYYRNTTTWHFGPNPFGCSNEQDDLAIITSEQNGFGYRSDDDTASFNVATPLNADTNILAGHGLISTNTDTDLFKFTMPANGTFNLNVHPYSIAANDEGSNLDAQVQLYNAAHQLMNTYNPADKLSVTIDTTLTAGIYYVSISGAGGPFASNYASLGSYTINGSVPDAGPVLVHTLQLRGNASGTKQQLNWTIDANVPIVNQVLETSENGFTFVPVDTLAPNIKTYTTVVAKEAQYRLHVYFSYGRQQYSNTVTLQNPADVPKPQLYTNVIHSNTMQVNSPAVYTYTITDVNGQVAQRGEIKEGASHITMGFSKSGLYIITFQRGSQMVSQKFIRG